MNDEEIKKYLKPLINSLEGGNISQLKAMKLHVKLLLDIRAFGISPSKIISIVGFKYSDKAFSVRLSECKKAYISNIEGEAIAVKESLLKSPPPVSSCKPPQMVNKTVSDNASIELIYSPVEWSTATRLGIKSVRLFNVAESHDLFPSDFNGVKNFSTSNVMAIINGWADLVDSEILTEDEKPTKEQYLSTFKG